MTASKPKEIITMNSPEKELTIALASELEKWRWKQWSKIFGG